MKDSFYTLFSYFCICLRISCRIVYTEMLARSWVLYYTSSTSSDDVKFWFTFCFFVAIWVANSKNVSTFSSSCSENGSSSYSERSSKESVSSESFSFLEFSEHSACFIKNIYKRDKSSFCESAEIVWKNARKSKWNYILIVFSQFFCSLRAFSAASCCAFFLLEPVPVPTWMVPIYAPTVYDLSWSDPDSLRTS